jgi:hypothetical protein
MRSLERVKAFFTDRGFEVVLAEWRESAPRPIVIVRGDLAAVKAALGDVGVRVQVGPDDNEKYIESPKGGGPGRVRTLDGQWHDVVVPSDAKIVLICGVSDEDLPPT